MGIAAITPRTADVLAAFDPDEAVALTQQLIAIPSPLWGETKIAEWIGSWCADRGFEVDIQTIALPDGGSTRNTIATLRGSEAGPGLMLCGHTDTSDWNGRPFREAEWKFDPFAGTISDGKLYGLGAINMKAGVASILIAAEAVRRTGVPLKGDLSVACVAAETGGGVGAIHVVESGLRPDFCIVTEAGDLDVGVVSVGYVQGKVRVKGEFKARVPYVNPIEKAAKVIAAFGPSYQPLKATSEGGWLRFRPDPMIPGFPRMAVRGIEHFQDVTALSFDLRMVPGMTEQQVTEDLRGLLDSIAAEDPEFRYELVVPLSPRQPNMPARAATALTSPLVTELVAAHEQVAGRAPEVGAGHRIGATADTCHFKGAGITCVEYGPGFIPTWPMVDEHIEVEQIRTATKVLALTAAALVT